MVRNVSGGDKGQWLYFANHHLNNSCSRPLGSTQISFTFSNIAPEHQCGWTNLWHVVSSFHCDCSTAEPCRLLHYVSLPRTPFELRFINLSVFKTLKCTSLTFKNSCFVFSWRTHFCLLPKVLRSHCQKKTTNKHNTTITMVILVNFCESSLGDVHQPSASAACDWCAICWGTMIVFPLHNLQVFI